MPDTELNLAPSMEIVGATKPEEQPTISGDPVTTPNPLINEGLPEADDTVIPKGDTEEIVDLLNSATADKVTESALPEVTSVEPGSNVRPAKVRADNDVSDYVRLINGSNKELEGLLNHVMESDKRSEKEKQEHPNPEMLDYYFTRLKTFITDQQILLSKFSTQLAKNENRLEECKRELRLAKVNPSIKNMDGKLSPTDARKLVIAKMQGIIRVHLYNSGFWVSIRPFSLAELQAFINEVDTEGKLFGQLLGGHFYLIHDIFIKKKFFDILPTLIMGSNFKEYTDTNKLFENISIHDYDTLLWACCTLLFKKGIDIDLYCTNKDCKHVESGVKIDFAKLCYHNTSIFKPEAMQFFMANANNELSEEDLIKYRAMLNFKKVVDSEQEKFNLMVPSIKRYLDFGLDLIGKITASVNGDKDLATNTQLYAQSVINVFRMFTPWVGTLEFADGEKKLLIDDLDAIGTAIETRRGEPVEKSVTDAILKFMGETKISFYGYAMIECPKCHKKISNENVDMIPFDMQQFFFNLSCQVLGQVMP